ncbi:MAG: hypothetical protein RJA25_2443 [Bacteroidota bacterium]|jgi:hypothetical protein
MEFEFRVIKDGVCRVFKTASTMIGAISFKEGKALLVLDYVSDKLTLNESAEIAVMIICSSGVLYTLSFTRLPAFWNKFGPNQNNQNINIIAITDRERNIKRIFTIIARTVWIVRAPFNLLNTFMGSQAILQAIHIDTHNTGSYILGAYAAISNQIAYNIYTYNSIHSNCMLLADKWIGRPAVNNNAQAFSFRKTALKYGLGIGTLSFCALSFFLTQKALYYIPVTNTLPPTVITGISAGSAFSSLMSEIFSKNMDLNHLIDSDYNDFIRNASKSKLVYPHSIMALIFTLTMAVSYYTGCMNLSEDTGLDKWMPEKAWWTILTYFIFAMSGGALELAFSVKPMFASIALPQQNQILQDGVESLQSSEINDIEGQQSTLNTESEVIITIPNAILENEQITDISIRSSRSQNIAIKAHERTPLLSAASPAGSSKFGIFSSLAKNEEYSENKFSHAPKYNVK